MKITIEEGYKTTPVLVFYYGKEDQFKFRVTPRKAQLLLKYINLIDEYNVAAQNPAAIKKLEAEIATKKLEIDNRHSIYGATKEIEVDLVDDALVIKEVAPTKPAAAPAPVAKPVDKEPKIIVDDTGVTFE